MSWVCHVGYSEDATMPALATKRSQAGLRHMEVIYALRAGAPRSQCDAGRLRAGLLQTLKSQSEIPDISGACRGDPVHNETQAAYMLKYSPLDNVRPQAYPHMLASGGAHITDLYWCCIQNHPL